jgi:hypothetical protein
VRCGKQQVVRKRIEAICPGCAHFDLKLSWSHSFHELMTIEPTMGIYNLFNFSSINPAAP